jgi:hypothetical protein
MALDPSRPFLATILYDIYARGRRQPVRVREAVWPLTAL